jgi:hypothetical protein
VFQRFELIVVGEIDVCGKSLFLYEKVSLKLHRTLALIMSWLGFFDALTRLHAHCTVLPLMTTSTSVRSRSIVAVSCCQGQRRLAVPVHSVHLDILAPAGAAPRYHCCQGPIWSSICLVCSDTSVESAGVQLYLISVVACGLDDTFRPSTTSADG